jgi:hypothetical protein
MKVRNIILFGALLLCLLSCERISNFIHDDEVVAKVGREKLYRSQLENYIPSGLSSEDSTNLALQYIKSWATEKLFVGLADSQLSKSEKDVTKELEEYRNSLLRFRYEQRYLNERLDTVITYSEIETYYNEHKDLFILDVPIVKARFLNIMKDSPNRERIIRKMSSSDYDDLVEADSLAYSSALKYFDYSDRWITAVSLAKEFETDYATMLSGLKNGYIEVDTGNGDLRVAYICDIRRGGTLAPIEYCEDRIRDIILSTRKHALFTDLERELLDDALDKQNFVIY